MERISRNPQKKPSVTLEIDDRGEDLRDRSCVTCACSFLIKKPAVQPIGVTAAQYDAMHDVRVCRLEPPRTVQTPDGPQPFQQPVSDANTCWQWKLPGSIPGEDNHETFFRLERERLSLDPAKQPPQPVCMKRAKGPEGAEALCTLNKGHSGLCYAPDIGHF